MRQHGIAVDLLESAGYEQYEVSNFALAGEACRHNLVYWRNGYYAAAGVGAHGHLPADAAAAIGLEVEPGAVSVRYWHGRGIAAYGRAVREGTMGMIGSEMVGQGMREEERLMLGLRLREGRPDRRCPGGGGALARGSRRLSSSTATGFGRPSGGRRCSTRSPCGWWATGRPSWYAWHSPLTSANGRPRPVAPSPQSSATSPSRSAQAADPQGRGRRLHPNRGARRFGIARGPSRHVVVSHDPQRAGARSVRWATSSSRTRRRDASPPTWGIATTSTSSWTRRTCRRRCGARWIRSSPPCRPASSTSSRSPRQPSRSRRMP